MINFELKRKELRLTILIKYSLLKTILSFSSYQDRSVELPVIIPMLYTCTVLHVAIWTLEMWLAWLRKWVLNLLLLDISLAVQWLRLHAPNGGVMGAIPGQGTKSPHGAANK